MSLFRELKALPRIVWILCFGGLLNRFGTFVLLFLALYLKDGGYGASQVGITLGAYGVGSVIASLVGGYLADVFGRRNSGTVPR